VIKIGDRLVTIPMTFTDLHGHSFIPSICAEVHKISTDIARRAVLLR